LLLWIRWTDGMESMDCLRIVMQKRYSFRGPLWYCLIVGRNCAVYPSKALSCVPCALCWEPDVYKAVRIEGLNFWYWNRRVLSLTKGASKNKVRSILRVARFTRYIAMLALDKIWDHRLDPDLLSSSHYCQYAEQPRHLIEWLCLVEVWTKQASKLDNVEYDDGIHGRN